MKTLIIDTESTGLFDYRKRADEEGQPRIAQIAMLLVEASDDWASCETITEESHFIRPDGWEMPADLAEKLGHGITQEKLLSDGISIAEALDEYTHLFDQAELIAGFNVEYDLKLVRGELRRLGRPDRYAERPVFCAMRAATSLCALPKKKGSGFKFPKLGEAVEILCGGPIIGAHDAAHDAQSSLSVILALRNRGVEIIGKEQPRKLQENQPTPTIKI